MKNKVIFFSLIIMILIGLTNIGFCDTILLFAGGSPGGSYELHGAALAEIVKRACPDITIDYRPGDGVANVMLVSSGKADMGFTHSVVARSGFLGIEPFDKKQPGLRAVFTTYQSRVQPVVLVSAGIDSFTQIVEEKIPIRIAVADIGSATELACRRLLGEYGITYDDITSWGGQIHYKELTEAGELLRLGKLDIIFASGAVPLSFLIELGTTRDIKFLEITDAVLAQMGEKYGYVVGWVKPENYDFVPEDTKTVAVMTTVMMREDIPEEIAYRVTKAVGDNLDYLYSVDASLKVVTKETMSQGAAIPLHPGAERYYREEGIIK